MADLIISGIGDAEVVVAEYDTVAQAILDEAWAKLYSGIRVERDKLIAGVAENATALESTYQVGGIQSGAKLSVGLEDYHVWEVDGADITVEPGEFGSTSAAHNAGEIIHVNAEWTPFNLFTEINNELKALSAPKNGLYRVRTVTLAYDATYYGYDLTDVADVDGIISVLTAAP